MTIDAHAARALPAFRPIFDRIEARLRSLDGDLIVDPIDKMVLFKHGGTFATLTSMTKWVAVGFSLRRKVASPRLARKVQGYGAKFHHVVNLVDPNDVDSELLDWLEEAFYASVGATGPAGADLVPDDVDVELA
jgi:hypothetical protein